MLEKTLESPLDCKEIQPVHPKENQSRIFIASTDERLHFHFSLSCIGLEKEMATHSSVLAWRIPGTGEAGGLLFMGSHRVRHD